MELRAIPYTTQIEHDGRKYQVSIANFVVPKCANCGEISVDQVAEEEIDRAFRKEAKLLTADQIRKNREALGLTQKQLAGYLKIAEATLSRWETGGQVQQRSLDILLRLFFGIGMVRDAVMGETGMAELGENVSTTA